MHVKSIKTAVEVLFMLFQVMPFIWKKVVPIFSLDEASEVLEEGIT
jgi:hypothetical protein